MADRRSKEMIETGGLLVDRYRFEVTARIQPVTLTRVEFELLWALISQSGQAVRREELMRRV
ncbi:MAG: hypothetical protein C4293_17340 [Nitrospiraceae bacterium]